MSQFNLVVSTGPVKCQMATYLVKPPNDAVRYEVVRAENSANSFRVYEIVEIGPDDTTQTEIHTFGPNEAVVIGSTIFSVE